MKVKQMSRLLQLLLVPLVLTPIAAQGQRLSESRFKELLQELRPGDEPWRTIPWRISLLDAQRAAAKEKKPLFIWAMDGHPLGCT